MPKSFTDCVKNGGKVITKSMKGGKYMHMCKMKNGTWVKGEMKQKVKRY